MSSIILAYTIGVLCGVGYMYLRYSRTMKRHMRELDMLRLRHAKIECQMDILNRINGIGVEEKE